MRRVFKTRHFHRWMRKTDLSDAELCHAVDEMSQGLIDADLGGGVVKKRIATGGREKVLVLVRWSLRIKDRAGSSCLDLKRMSAPILQTMNWKCCKI